MTLISIVSFHKTKLVSKLQIRGGIEDNSKITVLISSQKHML